MENYEQKYKEALERTKVIINEITNKQITTANVIALLKNVFSELKMPNDETIRKALIKFHKGTTFIYGIEGADIVNWLEKQNTFTVEDKRIYESIIKDACDRSLALTEIQREWLKTKIKM